MGRLAVAPQGARRPEYGAGQIEPEALARIDGFEFEAVFFVGIDRLADQLPSLFDRHLCVGVSRAATYGGMTCDGHFPAGLERVRQYLDTSGWRA